jgi:hypothetical protein
VVGDDKAKAKFHRFEIHFSLSRTNSSCGGVSMKNRARMPVAVIGGICLSLSFGSAGYTQTGSPVHSPANKDAVMTNHASGTFDVRLKPQATDDKADDATLGRMSIDKQFHGDIEGTSKGQMLTAGTAVKGSAGYVAIERVSGTLRGRSGSFVLQHSGTMTRGAPQLSITVVPDSGTGQLVGLTGKMAINIADGKHSYDFEYALAENP